MSKKVKKDNKALIENPATLNIKGMISYSKGGVVSKVIYSGNLNVTLFCMAAGTSMSEHTSTKEGFVYVIEGKGVFNLTGEDIMMLPMTTIHMGKNARHSLAAMQDTAFLLVLSE